jgi:chromosome segregation ATPase
MSRGRLAQGIIGLFTRLCAHGELIFELKKKLEMSRLGSVNASTSCKSSMSLPCSSCDSLRLDHDKLKRELRRNVILLESANEVIGLPCFACKDLRKDLDCARDELTLLKSNASLPCASCESLLAEINELKLTHSTCVDELKHARAKIDEISSRPCSLCSFDVNDDVSSTGLICTSCIEFENEVLALKQICDDMSAKLVEHNEMSANLEKENELLRTTYAECIEKEMQNLKNAPCGTCDRLKFENEILAKRCKSFCAKSLDSRDSCNSDVGVSKIASLQPS